EEHLLRAFTPPFDVLDQAAIHLDARAAERLCADPERRGQFGPRRSVRRRIAPNPLTKRAVVLAHAGATRGVLDEVGELPGFHEEELVVPEPLGELSDGGEALIRVDPLLAREVGSGQKELGDRLLT